MQFYRLISNAIGMLLLFSIAVISISSSSRYGGKRINKSLVHDGKERSYILQVPDVAFGVEKRPLVIVLHEGGGSPKSMVRLTEGKFNKMADRDGYLVVYPEGIKGYWNEGGSRPLSNPRNSDVDDVGFIRTLIETLQKDYRIDENRVFVTGMANGGLMAFKLACEMPEQIRAIASVTASMPVDLIDHCNNIKGVGLMMMNGTEDPFMPYEGGVMNSSSKEWGEVLSTDATIAHWLEVNECPFHSEQDHLPDLDPKDRTTVSRYRFNECVPNTQVYLYRIKGGGHAWPGERRSSRDNREGRSSRDIDACEKVWMFFERFG